MRYCVEILWTSEKKLFTPPYYNEKVYYMYLNDNMEMEMLQTKLIKTEPLLYLLSKRNGEEHF